MMQITEQFTGEFSQADEGQSRQGFEFIDFSPAHNVVARAKEKLSRVFGEAPSDSSTEAVMKQTGRGSFIGRLQVRSAVGNFVAEVIGEDPAKIVDQLTRKVRSQLRIWKRDRFIDAPSL